MDRKKISTHMSSFSRVVLSVQMKIANFLRARYSKLKQAELNLYVHIHNV